MSASLILVITTLHAPTLWDHTNVIVTLVIVAMDSTVLVCTFNILPFFKNRKSMLFGLYLVFGIFTLDCCMNFLHLIKSPCKNILYLASTVIISTFKLISSNPCILYCIFIQSYFLFRYR